MRGREGGRRGTGFREGVEMIACEGPGWQHHACRGYRV